MRTAGWRIMWKMIIASTCIEAILQLRKDSLKKIQACMGFEPLTSALMLQPSTNWATKPTGSRSLNRFAINPWKDDDEVMNVWQSYMGTAMISFHIILHPAVSYKDYFFYSGTEIQWQCNLIEDSVLTVYRLADSHLKVVSYFLKNCKNTV